VQVVEFFFFAVLMLVTTIIFAVMANFYTYITHPHPVDTDPDHVTKDTTAG